MDSDSSQNSLGQDLDQIGRLNISMPNMNFSQYLNRPSFNLPNLPNIDLKNLPRVKSFSEDISKYISQYISSYSLSDDTTITSMKTAISSRIQMNNFLNDLNLGLSLQTAIDRLEPLTSIIHEAIVLPVEDDHIYQAYTQDHQGHSHDALHGGAEDDTEPVGVDKIVHKHNQPLVNEIVNPEKPLATRSTRHHKKKRKHAAAILSTDAETNSTQPASDWDHVDELTSEEVKALTDLQSTEDFQREDLLRLKIQNIQGLTNLSQKLKNKLVTRLMMGNYYKYINKELPETVKRLHIELEPKAQRDWQAAVQPLTLTQDQNDLDIDMTSLSMAEDSSDTSMKDFDLKKDENEVTLTEEDLTPSYHNKSAKILGCNHYQRNCKLECPTCFKWFPCRFCHDQQISSHKLIRSEVKHILCMSCMTPQNPSDNYCMECGIELANYFCKKCVLYDNDPTKDIYHCEKCGICRLGLGLGKDYFHCDKCNICLSIDLKERHKCISNTTHCNCPICNEYLFTSINKVVFMKCGHLIHQLCYDELIKHSFKCPLCKKTVVEVETQFRILDQEILQLPLPSPYNLWRCIVSCNDCKGKSNVSYHVLGLKCKYCKSYNTNQLKLIKPEEEEQEEEEVDHLGASGMHSLRETENSMRLIGTNLQSNFRIGEQNVTTTIQDEEAEEDEYIDEDDERDLDNEEDLVNFRALKRLRDRQRQTKSSNNQGKNKKNANSHAHAHNNNNNNNTNSINKKLDGVHDGDMSNVSYIASVLQGFINSVLDEK